MVLQARASAMGAVLYEDVTLDREGNVTERLALELDDSKVPDGWRVWYRIEAPDRRVLAESDRTTRMTERERKALSETDRVVLPNIVFSCERVRTETRLR